jgi:hypothetical protein
VSFLPIPGQVDLQVSLSDSKLVPESEKHKKTAIKYTTWLENGISHISGLPINLTLMINLTPFDGTVFGSIMTLIQYFPQFRIIL